MYIDDVLVFSCTLEDRIRHLELVITKLQKSGLKLKPKMYYHFISYEVEYLKHTITPHGLKPTPKLTAQSLNFLFLTVLERYMYTSSLG